MTSTLPGPRGIGLARALRRFSRDRLGFQLWLRETYGDRVAARLGPIRFVFLYDPDDYEALYTGPGRLSKRHRVVRMHAEALGEGLLTGEGEHWKRHRRLVSPSFTPTAVQQYTAAFFAEAERGLAQAGSSAELHTLVLDIAMRIAVASLFGLDLGDRFAIVENALKTGQDHFVAYQTSPKALLPKWVPTAARRRYRGAIDDLDRVVYELIAERRARPGGDDLLARLLAVRDEDGQAFSDRDVRDEVITLFVAGHETSASTLAFVLASLAVRPDLQDRLYDELSGVPLTATALREAPLLKAVLEESLRMYGPAWMSGREPVEDLDLRGMHIPAGTQILLPLWAYHRDARRFDDPHTFRPERWMDGSLAGLHRYAFVPFGGGRRVCVGNHFAMLELAAVTAAFVRHARMEPMWDGAIRGQPHVTLRPAHPLPVRFVPR
ncbi:MAG: cytochrome P450 [Alphaproteobacteria bacterium]|nr:cytochrome P450 [Alphaproteobacteria bacterium]